MQRYVLTYCSPAIRLLVLLALVLQAPHAARVLAAEGERTYDVRRDIVYAERPDGQLKADVYVPNGPGPHPAVLVVHGGAWMVGRRTQLSGIARMLAQAGYTAVAISYRLAPRYPFPAQIEDCKSAVLWMRSQAAEYKIDPERIGGFGYSAGGHLVTLLGMTDATAGLEGPDAGGNATSTRLQAVVAGGAPCDFRSLPADSQQLAFWLGGTRSEKPDLYRLASPASFVSKDDPPVFFYHGEEDSLVPTQSPIQMVDRLKDVGVAAELYVVSGAGHQRAVRDRQATERALKFLDLQLRDRGHE